MTVASPYEGTNALPQDVNRRTHMGLWVEALNSGAGGFLDVRGDAGGHIMVVNPDGSTVGAKSGLVDTAGNPLSSGLSGVVGHDMVPTEALGLALRAQKSGTVWAGGNVLTTETIDYGGISGPGATVFAVTSAVVAVVNNTNQNITAMTLRFTETMDGVVLNQDYALTIQPSASGNYSVAVVPHIDAMLTDAQILVTYGTAPTSGKTTVALTLKSASPGGLRDGVLVVAAPHTTTQTSPEQLNSAASGVHISLNVSAMGTGHIDVALRHKNIRTGAWTAFMTFAAVVVAATEYQFQIRPGLVIAGTGLAGGAAMGLPQHWDLVTTPSDGSSWTYGATFEYLP